MSHGLHRVYTRYVGCSHLVSTLAIKEWLLLHQHATTGCPTSKEPGFVGYPPYSLDGYTAFFIYLGTKAHKQCSADDPNHVYTTKTRFVCQWYLLITWLLLHLTAWFWPTNLPPGYPTTKSWFIHCLFSKIFFRPHLFQKSKSKMITCISSDQISIFTEEVPARSVVSAGSQVCCGFIDTQCDNE